MCLDCGCNSITINSGATGAAGPAGADGAPGVVILTRDTTAYTTASSASFEALWSYTIAADTLEANGDEVWYKISAKAGDSSVGVFDEFKIKFNGTALTNPTTSYIGALTSTYKAPYVSSELLTITVRIVRLSATTVRIFLYLEANYGNSRQDLYATSTAANNLDSSTNSIALEVSSADTAGSIVVYDQVIYKLIQ